MSDITFLRDFSAQPAKPVDNQLTRLSGSFDDANARPSKNTPMAPPAPSMVNNRISSPTPTQKYTNPVTEEAPPVVVATPEPEPVVTPEVKQVKEVFSKVESVAPQEEKKVQRFGYGVVGDVPPGFKAAASCCNCKHSNFEVCSAFNFPITFNYTCDSFEIIKVEKPETYSKPAEVVKEPEPQPELSPIDKAVTDYDSVLSLFADGDIASSALSKVVERFSNRSEYADAFLRLKYRRFYEDRHGSLEGAFLTPEEGN